MQEELHLAFLGLVIAAAAFGCWKAISTASKGFRLAMKKAGETYPFRWKSSTALFERDGVELAIQSLGGFTEPPRWQAEMSWRGSAKALPRCYVSTHTPAPFVRSIKLASEVRQAIYVAGHQDKELLRRIFDTAEVRQALQAVVATPVSMVYVDWGRLRLSFAG